MDERAKKKMPAYITLLVNEYISDLGRLTYMMIILFTSDLGPLTDDNYTIYIRSRSVNRWLYYLYQI